MCLIDKQEWFNQENDEGSSCLPVSTYKLQAIGFNQQTLEFDWGKTVCNWKRAVFKDANVGFEAKNPTTICCWYQPRTQ